MVCCDMGVMGSWFYLFFLFFKSVCEDQISFKVASSIHSDEVNEFFEQSFGFVAFRSYGAVLQPVVKET